MTITSSENEFQNLSQLTLTGICGGWLAIRLNMYSALKCIYRCNTEMKCGVAEEQVRDNGGLEVSSHTQQGPGFF